MIGAAQKISQSCTQFAMNSSASMFLPEHLDQSIVVAFRDGQPFSLSQNATNEPLDARLSYLTMTQQQQDASETIKNGR